MSTGLKVRAKEKLYYDAIYGPGEFAKVGGKTIDLSEFHIKCKEDFNPNLMEAVGWTPDNAKIDPRRVKEDGTHRDSVEIANMQSDQLDETLRKARASKIKDEQTAFESKVEPVEQDIERV